MRTLSLFILFFGVCLPLLAHDKKDHDDDDSKAIVLSAVDVPERPTYHEHVRPIMESNCIGCHIEGQIAGYAPFGNAQDVIFAAQDIKFHVVSRLMPPWMPSPHQSARWKYERSLSDEEIAIIAAWVDAGADLGDPHDYKPATTESFDSIEIRADMTLQLEEAYIPEADVLDDYRCFAFPLNIEAPRFITGYEFIPDVVEMAHHNLVYPV